MSDTKDATHLTPITISMHARDNVAIVGNDGGLAAGVVLSSGLVLRDRVPQGHKVALVDLATDAPVLRYGIPIGYALKDNAISARTRQPAHRHRQASADVAA
jgi:hypothetical protein